MPGQFKHLAQHYAADTRHTVAFVTRPRPVELDRVLKLEYTTSREAAKQTHHYLTNLENAVLHGQAVLRRCQQLRAEGFVPDVVIGHPGWGETMFIKELFPHAGLLNYSEWYYRYRNSNIDFGGRKVSMDHACGIRARNFALLSALEACDWAYSPTEWQASQHPPEFRRKMTVVFDGIDADKVKPDPNARLTLPNGRVLTAADEVVTYVSRNLEPYRGFPSFMRAIPEICRQRPDAQIVVLGGDDVSYGSAPGDGRCWREVMLEEVPIDTSRVHLVGRLSYRDYLSMLQVSSVHVYLTVPFVLSWSAFESLAAGCLIVGSNTPPVREVLQHEHNGFIVDFFDHNAIAAQVADALARRHELGHLRKAARETVLGRYDLATCLPIQTDIIERIAARR